MFCSNSITDMLLIVFVMLYSLTVHCACPVDAQGDFSEDDINEKSFDYEALARLLETLNLHKDNRIQKRTCQSGLHSHNCIIQELAQLKIAENFLKSADSPGKRSSEQNYGFPIVERHNNPSTNDDKFSEQFVRPSEVFWTMLCVTGASQVLIKHVCRLRLGGHCLTEALDRAANQYYYLKSADSPGRRRRETAVSNRRIARL